MTLHEYYKRLKFHDWFYTYSDDHSVWERGDRAQREVERTAKLSPEHQKLYDDFRAHYFHKAAAPEEPIA